MLLYTFLQIISLIKTIQQEPDIQECPPTNKKKQKLRQLVKEQQKQRINKIQQQGHNFINSDAFKRLQKRYKYYVNKETDFSSQVIDLYKLECKQIKGYKVYVLDDPQGAYLIKGFVDVKQQYQIGFEALNQFIFRPYRTNLDGTNGLYHENASEGRNQTWENCVVEYIKQVKQPKRQSQTSSISQANLKYVNIKLQNQKILEQIDFSNTQLPYYFNQRIRMSNLGYQYDWPHRTYPSTKVPIPQTIKQLTTKAKSIYKTIKNSSQIQYHSEAVIVNYYKLRDYMTGHLDDGEEDQINPIFSFCLGLSCVFLIGGETREKQPHAVRLDAGDLLIMSGKSRVCYHGVPRIIENSYNLINDPNVLKQQQFNQIQEVIQSSLIKQILQKKILLQNSEYINKRYLNGFQQIHNYLKQHRININVGQVWVRKQEKQIAQGKTKDKQCHLGEN